MEIKKITAIIFLVLVLANFILFAMNQIQPLMFWMIIILCAVIAYIVIPRVGK